MRVLVSGGTGMVGSHFMRMFREQGHNVWGIARYSASSRMSAIQDESILRCDILERDNLSRIFNEIKPDIIIHMAAQAFNGESWNSEYMTHMTNYIGSLNVLWCARNFCPEAKILLACSSAEYGSITEADCPLKEDRQIALIRAGKLPPKIRVNALVMYITLCCLIFRMYLLTGRAEYDL